MRQKTAWRVGALLVGLTVALAGCGGGSTASGLSTGSTGSGGVGGTTTVSGVAMPSSVSVVTATHAN